MRMLCLVAVGVAVVSQALGRSFTYDFPKKFILTHSFTAPVVRLGPHPLHLEGLAHFTAPEAQQ